MKLRDIAFATLILLLMVVYGLACIFYSRKVTDYHSTHRFRYGNYFYGTEFRTRLTGFVLLTMAAALIVGGVLTS